MIRRIILSNSQIKLINDKLFIKSLYSTASIPKLNNNKNDTYINKNNNNNNNNHTNNHSTSNNNKNKKKYSKHQVIRVAAPPTFIAERISSIINSIFTSLNNNSIIDSLINVDKLKSINVERYQPIYAIFQKLLELCIENNQQDSEKINNQLKSITEHLVKNYSDTDLIQVYCYSLLNEKEIIIQHIENAMVHHLDSNKKSTITSDIIRNLLYFKRVDLALKVFRDRFTVYSLGNSMGLVSTFFDYHIGKGERDLAEVWDSKKTTLYHNDAKLLENFAQKSTNFNLGLIDDPTDYRHFYQKTYFFCNGLYCKSIPKQLPPNQLPKDRRDSELIQRQLELSKAVNDRDSKTIERILLDYFFKCNIIPYKDSLIKALSVLKRSSINDSSSSGGGELNINQFPAYVVSILTYRDIQKQIANSFTINDIEKLTHLPDYPIMNCVFQILCDQGNLNYPIKLFKLLSKINGFHFTLKRFDSFCLFIINKFNQLLEIYSAKEMEEIIELIGKHKKSHNLLISSVNYDNLVMKYQLNKYNRIVSKIKHRKDQDKARRHFLDQVERVYNEMKQKNKATIETGFELLKLKNVNLNEMNKVYSDAIQHGLLREYTEIFIMDLINNKDYNKLESSFNNDPMIIQDISQRVLLEYFKLINQNQKLIMKRFLEKASHTQHFIPDLINYVNNINLNSTNPNKMVSQLIQSIKDNKMDDLVQLNNNNNNDDNNSNSNNNNNNSSNNSLNQNQINIINKIFKSLESGQYIANTPL